MGFPLDCGFIVVTGATIICGLTVFGGNTVGGDIPGDCGFTVYGGYNFRGSLVLAICAASSAASSALYAQHTKGTRAPAPFSRRYAAHGTTP